MNSSAPNTRADPIIQMEDVAVGSMLDLTITVAEDVNWTMNVGDYWAIAGLQGAGKSDFLLMTGGLMGPLQGRYRLFGQDMPIFDESRLKTRLRLGLVFDGGQLFNQLTVRENVALPLRYHRDLSAADEVPQVQVMLEAMELGPWADSTPGAIGHHWQKRVGLARALMLKPEILLVDNPLAGLDLRHMTWWLSFLSELSHGHALMDGQPVSLAITTADLRPWKGQARQLAILRDRHLTVLGTWDQLDSASESVRQFLSPVWTEVS
jgi:ABC-type transporter Mla maintaining outer membrane lipid asymmetry ATPase subunit MlaF